MVFKTPKDKGFLFLNKKRSNKSPDFSGTINLGGIEYPIIAWTSNTKDNKKYLKILLSKVREKPKTPVFIDGKETPKPSIKKRVHSIKSSTWEKKEAPSYARYINVDHPGIGTRDDFNKDRRRIYGDVSKNRVNTIEKKK